MVCREKGDRGMQPFLDRHEDSILGVLHGFDRLIFRGRLTSLSHARAVDKFLGACGVRYQDFGKFVQGLSERIKTHAKQFAEKHQRPYRYLENPSVSKEALARKTMEQDGIDQGLVCVLACVEPCQTFAIKRDPQTKRPSITSDRRKCLYFYFYFVDREFGLMHVRLQSWIPMTVQVWLNGRDYLARRLDRAGIDYRKEDNCFTWIADLPRAQQMLDELNRRNWPRLLGAIARRLNPWLASPNPLSLGSYYWTLSDSEYATDVLFRDPESLARVYPALVRHAAAHFHCRDVLRFLGRRINARFSGEVVSNVKHRVEGVRVKHWVEENSIKMYDKAGSVLRVETTINNAQRFKVRRQVIRYGQAVVTWAPLRKGVCDIQRRVEICRAANERYLEALSVVGQPSPSRVLLDPLTRRITRQGRPYRGLHPMEPEEARLFGLLQDGIFQLQGFRNRDVRRRLYPGCERDPGQKQQASGRVTRLLRLLRAHGLIRKVPHTFYYRISNKGHEAMSAALKLRDISPLAIAS